MSSDFDFESLLNQLETVAFALGRRLHSSTRLRLECLDVFLDVIDHCPGVSQESALWNKFRRAIVGWDNIPRRMFESAVEDVERELLKPAVDFLSGKKPSREWMTCWLLFSAFRFASCGGNYHRPLDFEPDPDPNDLKTVRDVDSAVCFRSNGALTQCHK